MFEVKTMKRCLNRVRNEPWQRGNCNSGCISPSLIADSALGAVSLDWSDSLHVWQMIPCKVNLREPT